MRIRFIALGLILGLVFLGGVTFAQKAKPGDIGGTIFDREGRIAPGATVIATHRTSGVSFRDVADKKGRFRIRKVPPGEYRIDSVYNGVTYRYPALVRVNPGELTTLCLQMETEQARTILKLREGKCEPKPVLVIWPYVVAGAGAAGAAVAAVLILQEEEAASPTRP